MGDLKDKIIIFENGIINHFKMYMYDFDSKDVLFATKTYDWMNNDLIKVKILFLKIFLLVNMDR